MVASQDIWTIQAALEWTEGYLARKEDVNPRLSAQWLIAAACNMSRMQLYTDLQRPLSMDERAILRDYVSRRAQGEPLQYVIGEVGFRFLTLKVSKGVLIPRPETEVLVSEVLNMLPPAEVPIRATELGAKEIASLSDNREIVQDFLAPEKRYLVADVGCGSGCIACSIAFERPDTEVYACDIAQEALKLCEQNAQSTGVAKRVHVLESDLLSALPKELVGGLDVVVSNPPYIPSEELLTIPDEVRNYEPKLALDGGEDGLDVFRALLAQATVMLKSGGILAVELHETCLDEAFALALDAGFIDVEIHVDLAQRPRVLTAHRA